jgi:NADH:ubiquinone oxidoreductase subunit F (NADH-binding)
MDYDNLIKAGAMLIGGLVVMSEKHDRLKLQDFYELYQHESCGKVFLARMYKEYVKNP